MKSNRSILPLDRGGVTEVQLLMMNCCLSVRYHRIPKMVPVFVSKMKEISALINHEDLAVLLEKSVYYAKESHGVERARVHEE